MKKLVLAGVVSLVSAVALADKPLTIQNSTPATLGTSPNYVSDASTQDQNKFSVKLGYAGNKIDSDVYARLNGFEIGAAYDFSNFGIWAEYENQEDGDADFDQFAAGVQYKFYNQNNVYVQGATGLGYANLKVTEVDGTDTYKLDGDYLYIPVTVETGYMFTPNFGAYATLGYKWSFNQNLKAYENGMKVADDKSSTSDLHGVSYGFGVRFAF